MRHANRFAAFLFAAFILPALPGIASAAEDSAAQARKAKCDEQRKACYAGQTQTGPNGARYVPPDVVQQCEGAYRACVAGH